MNRPLILGTFVMLAAAASFASAAETNASATITPIAVAPAPAPSSMPVDTSATSYTTVKGDTLGSVAKKFGCSSRSLKKLNKLKSSHLKPGTVLQIPKSKTAVSRHAAKNALAAAAAKKPVVLSAREQRKLALAEALKATDKYRRRHSPVAQPVQDFDIAPSEFASCPPPPANGAETNFAASTEEGVAPLPSATGQPSGYSEPLAVQSPRAGLLPVPASLPMMPAPEATAPTAFSADRSSMPAIATTRPGSPGVLTPPSAPKKTLASAIADFFGGGSHGLSASESGEWGNRFLSETRNLAAQSICYDGSWRPEGESRRWEMDCSNTTRYLYQVTAGIQLPRTASDQYYYLHLQDKAWDVPMTAAGFADCNFLRGNLKPGDLLFWENTYRPERQPPITHVMIFLGSDARGRWLMAGSQGSRGFYNRRHSGPDVYVFDPTHAVGGYTTWLGLVRHHGRFVAYGRPLEADVKKLSVAAND